LDYFQIIPGITLLKGCYWFYNEVWQSILQQLGKNKEDSEFSVHLKSHDTVLYTFRMHVLLVVCGSLRFVEGLMFFHLILSYLVLATDSSSRSNRLIRHIGLLSNIKRPPIILWRDGHGYESMRTLVESSVLLLSFACSLCYICYLNICHCTVNISQLDSDG
jgi:hypothetical protein